MFSAGHVGTVAARRPRQPFNPFTPSRDDDLDDRGRIPAHELIHFTELCEETESRFRKRKKKQGRPLTKREKAELRENEAMMDAHYTSYDNVLRYVFLRFKSPPYTVPQDDCLVTSRPCSQCVVVFIINTLMMKSLLSLLEQPSQA